MQTSVKSSFAPIWMTFDMDLLLHRIHLWVQFHPEWCMGGSMQAKQKTTSSFFCSTSDATNAGDNPWRLTPWRLHPKLSPRRGTPLDVHTPEITPPPWVDTGGKGLRPLLTEEPKDTESADRYRRRSRRHTYSPPPPFN